MWRLASKSFRGKMKRNGIYANKNEGKGKERRRKRQLGLRFLVVNPFSNFFIKKANRRRLEDWRDVERKRVGVNKEESPARHQESTRRETEKVCSDTPPGNLGRTRCEHYETGWKDSEPCFGMRRKERRIGAVLVTKGGARVDGTVSCVRSDAEEDTKDPCREITRATETWDHRYQAYRCQVATDLSEKHSSDDDLFRLRKGREEVFRKLQEFGYMDGKAAVDDSLIVRGFDRLCRDVCEWRRQATGVLRLRHQQMNDTEDGVASEAHVQSLTAARKHIGNYETRIKQQLSAKDSEIESFRRQLDAAQTLSFTMKLHNRPPVQPKSIFTSHKVTARVFRGCMSSDVTYWAQKTAIFPDNVREAMLEKTISNARPLRMAQVGSDSSQETLSRQVDPESVDDKELTK